MYMSVCTRVFVSACACERNIKRGAGRGPVDRGEPGGGGRGFWSRFLSPPHFFPLLLWRQGESVAPETGVLSDIKQFRFMPLQVALDILCFCFSVGNKFLLICNTF